jgi:hypothetical protein
VRGNAGADREVKGFAQQSGEHRIDAAAFGEVIDVGGGDKLMLWIARQVVEELAEIGVVLCVGGLETPACEPYLGAVSPGCPSWTRIEPRALFHGQSSAACLMMSREMRLPA